MDAILDKNVLAYYNNKSKILLSAEEIDMSCCVDLYRDVVGHLQTIENRRTNVYEFTLHVLICVYIFPRETIQSFHL